MQDLYPTVGVTSTPVIDTAADHGHGVIYLTADTPAPPGSSPHGNPAEYLMYALRLDDLSNEPTFNGGQPLKLTGTSSGYTFDAAFQLQRPALLEMGGEIFAAFGSHCDTSPYFGWVMGVRASDGTLLGTWADQSAVGARGGGIWQAGGGLMSDGPGRLFVATGNGFDAPGSSAEHTPAIPTPGNKPPSGLASSAITLRVGSDGSLSTDDFFTPCNAYRLDGRFQNLDFGSSGVVALPGVFSGHRGPPLLVVSSKVGTIYLLDRNSLGGFSQGRKTAACPAGGDAVPGELPALGSVWGEFAVWPFDGGWLYVPTGSPGPGPDETHGGLHFYRGHLGSMKLVGATGGTWGPGSGSPIITSVGANSDTALLWDVSKGVGASTLHVYLAEVPRRAHAPKQVAQFSAGPFTKFAPPGVGNDEIFVPGDGHVVAFGIKSRH